MSAIDKIVKGGSAGKQTPAAEARADKEKKEELVKELVKDNVAAPAPEKRKPGRPRTNSTDKQQQPKSPRASSIELPMQAPKTGTQVPNQSPVDLIRNKMVVSSLQLYAQKFPEVVGDSLKGYNPFAHTPEENQSIIDGIIAGVRNQAEMEGMPVLTSAVLDLAEENALRFAYLNPGSPVSGHILDLQGISEAVQRDPVLGREIALLECQVGSILPKNPALRAGISLVRVVSTVMSRNRQLRQYAVEQASAPPPDPDKYKEF